MSLSTLTELIKPDSFDGFSFQDTWSKAVETYPGNVEMQISEAADSLCAFVYGEDVSLTTGIVSTIRDAVVLGLDFMHPKSNPGEHHPLYNAYFIYDTSLERRRAASFELFQLSAYLELKRQIAHIQDPALIKGIME